MDKKLLDALSEQIKNELYSSYLYLSMSSYFELKNLTGFANWMRIQSQEELMHAMKFFDFLNDRGQKIILQAIPQPPSDFSSAEDVFSKTLKHEKGVTALINDLHDTSRKVNDNAASIFLQWFVTEQVEEEKNASKILDELKLIKDSASALLMLDRELATRVMTPEAENTAN